MNDLIISVYSRIKARFAAEDGAGLVEYSLLVALIAIVAIGAVQLLGEKVSTNYDSTASRLP